jgi:hypothetical protein
MHPEELRARTKRGLIPGAKTGRRWVYLDIDLAAYVRSRYTSPRQELRLVPIGAEPEPWGFANAAQSGGLTSLHPTASEYADLLKRETKPKRRNSTTD